MLLILTCAASAQILAPGSLRCEYFEGVAVIDTASPRFFWVPRHEASNQRQTAYQIQVSTRPSFDRNDAWDTGKVSGSETIQIEYKGAPLRSNTTYYWRVRFWDTQDAVSPFSASAQFETATLKPDEWKAQWITGDNLMRREFDLPSTPKRARAYISGLGWSELYVNGSRAGDAVLDPGWSNEQRRALYVSHDITSMLRPGRNAIGVMLGRGRNPERALLIEVHIALESGEQLTVRSDTAWKTKAGPVVSDDIYDGETYDARNEIAGWNQPGLDEGGWRPAGVVARPIALSLQSMPPVRVQDTLPPRSISSPSPGVAVFDFGQNMSGWVRLRMACPRGTRVRVRYAELLFENGTLNRGTLRRAKAEDVYIARGDGEEFFEPRFTYHGFRYVEVTGYAPSSDDIRARVISSDLRSAGRLATSKELVNQIQNALTRTLRSNLVSIPTDNNQRDERLGWLGDAHVTFDVVSANFDAAAFYSNYLRLIADEQDASGNVPNTVPSVKFPGSEDRDPAWASAYPLLVWHMYSEYGDRRAVEQHYAGVRSLVEHIRRSGVKGRFGDWVAIEPTPADLITHFYYILDLDVIAQMADVLGRSEDARTYSALAKTERAVFADRYAGVHTQTACALRLTLGLKQAMQAVVESLTIRNNTHLATGMIGTRFLLSSLTAGGRSDLAWELITQRTYPSWGFMLASGATTLWELWQFRVGSRMNSHNQPMLGGALVWLYDTLAGIRGADPGYRRVVLRPYAPADLDHLTASRDTVSGTFTVAWQRSDGRFRMDVTIPVNTTAEIILPDNSRRITGSGVHTFELNGMN